MNVIASKTVAVSKLLDTTDVITLPLNSISFNPDVVVLKSVSFHDENKISDVMNGYFMIESNLSSDDIFHFTPQVGYTYDGTDHMAHQTLCVNPGVEIHMQGNHIPNTLTFKLKYQSGVMPSTTKTLSLVLQFIKYA